MSISFSIEDNNTIAMSMSSSDDMAVSIGEVTSITTDPYDGAYEWTPSAETQTIEINGLTATADITINPIPSNYGLITWNGSALTVS